MTALLVRYARISTGQQEASSPSLRDAVASFSREVEHDGWRFAFWEHHRARDTGRIYGVQIRYLMRTHPTPRRRS